MAAPTTSYLNNANDKITLETTDANENLLSTFDSLIASYIYGAADIKALFYLDAIYEIEVMAADEVTVVRKGFIGVVENDPNGFNYKHHAAARRFHVQFDTTTDAETFLKNWIAFSDGGLNTLGNANTKTNHGDTVGNMFLSGEFKAAYYVPTSQYGFNWRNGINGTIKTVQFGTTGQGAALINKTPSINGNGVKAKDTVSFRAFIENAEGRWETDWRFVTVKPRLIDSGFHDTYASFAYNRVGTRNIYVDTEVVGVGSKFWTEITGTNDAEFGYYSFNGYYYKYGLSGGIPQVIEAVGVGNGWPVGDPGNSNPNPEGFARFHATGYSGVSQAAADAMAQQPGSFDLVLYEDPTTHLWYTGYTGTYPNVTWDQAWFEDGYYSEADQFGNVTGRMYLVNRDNQYT